MHDKSINTYTKYIKVIYENKKYILCNKQYINNRYYYLDCNYNKKEYKKMHNKIRNIFKDYRIHKNVILQFRKKKNYNNRNLSNKKYKIETFNKEYGNRFFILLKNT